MAKERKSDKHVDEGGRRSKRKREYSQEERSHKMKTRVSTEKERRRHDREVKHKDKKSCRHRTSYSDSVKHSDGKSSASDSDFELDYEDIKRNITYSTSDSEEYENKAERQKDRSSNKHRESREKKKFDNVPVVTRNNYYRSNMRTSFRDLIELKLTEAHFVELKQTPFWLLLKSVLIDGSKTMMRNTSKNEEDIREILRNFDEKAGYFRVASQDMTITKHDAELIFGIVPGTHEIKPVSRDFAHTEWVQRCFREDFQRKAQNFPLYRPLVFKKIKLIKHRTDIQSIQDVARLLCCFVLAGILCPVRSGALPWNLTAYLEEFYEMCKYDWSSYVVETLLIHLKKSKDMKAGGCAMLLPYWICEHTTWVQPIDEKAFPRFLKWDLHDLTAAINKGKMHRYSKVYPDILRTAKWEKKCFMELSMFAAFVYSILKNHNEEFDIFDYAESPYECRTYNNIFCICVLHKEESRRRFY